MTPGSPLPPELAWEVAFEQAERPMASARSAPPTVANLPRRLRDIGPPLPCHRHHGARPECARRGPGSTSCLTPMSVRALLTVAWACAGRPPPIAPGSPFCRPGTGPRRRSWTMGARSVEDAHNAVLATAKELLAKGLVEGTSGNVSARMPDGNVCITPSSVDYRAMTLEDLVVIDPVGRGRSKAPGPRPRRSRFTWRATRPSRRWARSSTPTPCTPRCSRWRACPSRPASTSSPSTWAARWP